MTNQLPSIGNPASTTKTLRAALEASNGNVAQALAVLGASRATYAKNAARALQSSVDAKTRQGFILDGSWTLGRMAGIEIGFSATVPGTFAAYDDAYHAAQAAKRAVSA